MAFESPLEDKQQPLPLGYLHGKAVIEPPHDLYIPPDALEVILDSFEGPLDLLLYLIRRNKLDILELPVVEITEQYMEYIALMQELKLELAAEYLLMAALLAEIKSRLLLPRHTELEESEEDPRARLLQRLQEYELFKQKAHELNTLPRMERDFWQAKAELNEQVKPIRLLPGVELKELGLAFAQVLKRASSFEHHHIEREAFSTRERMSQILAALQGKEFVEFASLFQAEEGKAGAVVTFMAILELCKEQLLELTQVEVLTPIYVRLQRAQSEDCHG